MFAMLIKTLPNMIKVPRKYNLYNIDMAVILGSGLKCQLSGSKSLLKLSYEELPGIDGVGVQGHNGVVTLIEHQGRKICFFEGRHHLYEGKTPQQVQSIVKFIHQELSPSKLLITNAAGGINSDLKIAELLIIRQIMNYQIPVDSRGLLANLVHPPLQINTPLTDFARDRLLLKSGSYAAVLGPNYETSAEIDLFRSQGCDAVGMSTYLEALYALENNINTLLISVITNSWHQSNKPSHKEVLENSRKAQGSLAKIIKQILKR